MRREYRRTTMRRARSASLLAALVLVAGGALGCGADDDGRASDTPSTSSPASSPASSPSSASPSDDAGSPSPSPGELEHQVIELVTETAVGGEVGRSADLSDPEAAAEFLAELGGALPGRLQQLVEGTAVPDGMVPYATVVAVGCDVPDEVRVTRGAVTVLVEAVPVAAPQQECLAAMTTVALVLVPAAAV